MSRLTERLALVPRFLRTDAVRLILAGRQVVDDCKRAGWLRPVHRRHRLTIYSYASVHFCADRIDSGEYPKEVA